MKILYKGFVYESVYQTDMFMSDDDAKKKYAEHLDDQAIAGIADNGSDDIEDDLKNTNVSVGALLKKWDLKGYPVDSDYIFEEAGGYFIIRNREVFPVEKLINDVEDYYREFPEFANLERRMSDEFWKFPETLYHATPCENKEEILKNGLLPGWGTGLSNRNSHGVFTSTELDGYIDSYGNCKFAIDTMRMKQAGDMPLMQKEPEVFEYLVSQAIGHRYGVNVDRWVDSGGGMDHNTWIMDGGVSPEYLKLEVDGDEED